MLRGNFNWTNWPEEKKVTLKENEWRLEIEAELGKHILWTVLKAQEAKKQHLAKAQEIH